jgi:hypothetical protein
MVPLQSMWLDRATGAKRYMLSARKLGIAWGDTPQYWRWIPITLYRFACSQITCMYVSFPFLKF